MTTVGGKTAKDYSETSFDRILVVAFFGVPTSNALSFCRFLAPHSKIHIAGLVVVPPGQPLSLGASNASRMRKQLYQFKEDNDQLSSVSVDVVSEPFDVLCSRTKKFKPNLIVIDETEFASSESQTLSVLVSRPPADLAILKGVISASSQRILVPIRGGPYSELALRMALMSRASGDAAIDVLTIRPLSKQSSMQEWSKSYTAMKKMMRNMSRIRHSEIQTDNPADAILNESKKHDLIFMGASGSNVPASTLFSGTVQLVADGSPSPVVVVKTRQKLPESFDSDTSGQQAISVLVDSWFARNTFHASEFSDLRRLVERKRELGQSISVVLPALNEAQTIETVITSIQRTLMDDYPLVDELIVMDSGSSDDTRDIAKSLGVPVYIHQEVLPAYGARVGKGEALWKGLFLTRGDIVVYSDTDITNFNARFVWGPIGALLSRPKLQFVKGFYRRPLKVHGKLQAGGGGRVTELMARPLINLLFPELSGIVQPLSGEYGGRRSFLERAPFYSGYGVEIGLLIDALNLVGLDAICQVDLLERIHQNQNLTALSKMAFLILQAAIDKIESKNKLKIVDEFDRTMKIIRHEPGHLFLSVENVFEHARPPMCEIPEYRERR